MLLARLSLASSVGGYVTIVFSVYFVSRPLLCPINVQYSQGTYVHYTAPAVSTFHEWPT